MEELLPQLFLGQGRTPRILFPRDGMIFYREAEAEAGSQAIPCWIVADPQDRITVELNGTVLASPDSSWLLPVEPGSYHLEVRGKFGREAVSYSVR